MRSQRLARNTVAETKYKAVWGRMTQIKEYAKLINEAIDAGADPMTVELNDAPGRNGQGSQVAVLFPLFTPYTAYQSFHFVSI